MSPEVWEGQDGVASDGSGVGGRCSIQPGVVMRDARAKLLQQTVHHAAMTLLVRTTGAQIIIHTVTKCTQPAITFTVIADQPKPNTYVAIQSHDYSHMTSMSVCVHYVFTHLLTDRAH